MKGSNKSRWAAVLVVAIVAGAAYWFWQGREAANSGAPTAKARQQGPEADARSFWRRPRAVQAATATSEAVPRYLSGLGTVTAANTVTVRSRVDANCWPSTLPKASRSRRATCSRKSIPASLKWPSPGRRPLAKRSGHPGQRPSRSGALPAAGQNQSGFPAGAGHQQSLVSETQVRSADEAAVASAQLQLNWSRITAPIDGRVGLQVDIGNQIASGDTTGIVVLTQTHPIDVVFTLPENQIATVVQAQKAGKAGRRSLGPHQ
jgi:multidrug efflux system membrane fusion protein